MTTQLGSLMQCKIVSQGSSDIDDHMIIDHHGGAAAQRARRRSNGDSRGGGGSTNGSATQQRKKKARPKSLSGLNDHHHLRSTEAVPVAAVASTNTAIPFSQCHSSQRPVATTTAATVTTADVAIIHKATTVQLSGRGGYPIYHTHPLCDCEVLQPVGRWKFRFNHSSSGARNTTTTTKRRSSVRLSPVRFVEVELRIGHVVVDCFRRHDIVTLQNRHGTNMDAMTVTIAESGTNQLAIIAIVFHVPLDISRALGLTHVGDTASLDHVIHYLHYKAPTATFQFWSIGIPATIMSQVLYTNLIQLPGANRPDINENNIVASTQNNNKNAKKHHRTSVPTTTAAATNVNNNNKNTSRKRVCSGGGGGVVPASFCTNPYSTYNNAGSSHQRAKTTAGTTGTGATIASQQSSHNNNNNMCTGFDMMMDDDTGTPPAASSPHNHHHGVDTYYDRNYYDEDEDDDELD